ncbi:MAG: DUF1491 family protein [Parvibaculum sp.]|uniref:DUF1491 family protein n=1 Tax=Parvibaculum sp. TaxID=2024848 RepID=UPI0027187A6D|nr:DUF1491 family protein [Parvibaculum sp.]MDO8838548.1 DUF1491 family protein [Parvibaculum sp.]
METAPRLKAEIWVKALIRRCETAGGAAMVVRRGDATAGVVLVKVNRLDGRATVYAPARDGEGALVWMARPSADPAPELDADAYIEKQRDRDPDLWVVEIEDREGRHFLTEPVR